MFCIHTYQGYDSCVCIDILFEIGFFYFSACQGFDRHGTVGGRDPTSVRSPSGDGGSYASQGLTQPVANILPLARLGTRGHVHKNHSKSILMSHKFHFLKQKRFSIPNENF